METGKRRGRPLLGQSNSVAEALLSAAEKCLETKTYNEITVREIAAIAGVNQSMVNYYFENKAELFLDLIKSAMQEQADKMKALEQRLDEVLDHPTHALIEAMRQGLYRHQPVIMLLQQLSIDKDPILFNSFSQRIASLAVNSFGRYIKLMSDRGRYRSDVDVGFLTLAVVQLALTPLTKQTLKASFGLNPDALFSQPWFDFLEDALDRLLRPSE